MSQASVPAESARVAVTASRVGNGLLARAASGSVIVAASAGRATKAWLAPHLREMRTSPAVRAGVLAAAGSVNGSLARGLLPRRPTDQAMATGVIAVGAYHVVATTSGALETAVLARTGNRRVHARAVERTPMLVASIAVGLAGASAARALEPDDDEAIARALARTTAQAWTLAGACSAAVVGADALSSRYVPRMTLGKSLMASVAIGGIYAGMRVQERRRLEHEYGLIDPDRPAVIHPRGLRSRLRSAGIGAATGAGLLALATAEEAIAVSSGRLLAGRYVGRVPLASPLTGHAVSLAVFGTLGTFAFSAFKGRVERHGDVMEPAYPEPPSSPLVSAGPESAVRFDEIGKEGRRFVLMALTADEITAVMGEPATDPIRIVGGFESANSTEERAKVCLSEMKRLGAFERGLVCIASPTGVGYVSYVFAESLEYLTRGDCAIVMPQYALVPSALALFDTRDGVALQRRVLQLAREHINLMPEHERPRLVQFGESLGAQVALDVAYPIGSREFERFGLEAGLYLGVPFRSRAWIDYQSSPERFDTAGIMQVTNGDSEAPIEDRVTHLLFVNDDDPVNKFSYRMFVQPPWWMGPPSTRPPKVPRETKWRPGRSWALTLVDLKNGMEFKPGTFLRRGHDYRIDTREAVMRAYRLDASPEQSAAIERALREREIEWATRRLAARRYAAAKAAISSTIESWGLASGTGSGSLGSIGSGSLGLPVQPDH